MSCIAIHRFLGLSFTILVLLLLTRALIVEPFQITTGSMAPVLLGVHRQCKCPNCGFLVVVGTPSDDAPPEHYDVKCPKCGRGQLGLDKQPDLPGQKVLVDKLAFEWRAPRRWEVIVFRGPDDEATPFVKRVVGLPGESVQIKDGDVYINGELSAKPAAVWLANEVIRDQTDWPPAIDPKLIRTDYWVYNGAKVNHIEVIPSHLIYEFKGNISRFLHYQSVGRHGIQSPYQLGPDEYFVLGDNSAVSDDSRFWPTPGVRQSALIGPVIFPRLDTGK